MVLLAQHPAGPSLCSPAHLLGYFRLTELEGLLLEPEAISMAVVALETLLDHPAQERKVAS
jgi:hypothetical protein